MTLFRRWWGSAPAPNRQNRARASKAIALSLAFVVLVVAGLHFSGDALLNRFVRPKLEQAFAAHHPGFALRLGRLHYDFWRNGLGCDDVALTRPDGAPVRAGSIAATGLRWDRLLVAKPDLAEVFGRARIDVTEFSAVCLDGEYRVQCGQLRLSVPEAELSAQALTLQPALSDEAFFAADAFRRVRYSLAAASGILRGVDFAELFKGQAYRAQSVELVRPVFESLVDREKPRHPFTDSPAMPHEMLAAIKKPFRIDRLTIIDGRIQYGARRSAGADPGVLSFTAVQMAAVKIANTAAGGQVIGLRAEGRLMDAGPITLQMRLPVAPSALAFQYSARLSAMDLTRLDEYMGGTGRIQIKSGSASEVSCDIDVVDGHAHGVLRGGYRDLQVKVVNQDTGREKGVRDHAATLLANHVTMRNENTPDQAGAMKEGKVDYARQPDETFLQFAWLALRSGVMDLIKM